MESEDILEKFIGCAVASEFLMEMKLGSSADF